MPTIKNYLSLVKFSHTIFAMPFAMIGFFLGVQYINSIPFISSNNVVWDDLRVIGHAYLNSLNFMFSFALVIICMITARSAAMAFHRYLDRTFDEKNPRTAIREISRGIISPNSALRFVILNCILFITATFFINKICFYLSPVALFVILFYSYTKRFTPLCHLVLGLGLSLAPIGAYLAVTGKFNILPVLFSFTVLFWVSGFDIIYALQDMDFDKANNLYSIPASSGKKNALTISVLLHILSASCIIAAGIYGGFGWLFWLGVIFFLSLLIYQHTLVNPENLSKVNLAFFTTNGIASVIFCIFVLLDLLINKINFSF